MYRFAFVMALVLIVTSAAWAQMPQQASPGAMMPNQPGMGQASMMNMSGMCPMMGQGMGCTCCQTPVVLTDANNIYILRGNQLLRYDKYTLKLEASATLPAPPPTQAGQPIPCCAVPQTPPAQDTKTTK